MRRVLIVLVGTAAIVVGLSACGQSDEQPSGQETGQPATTQVESPDQELAQIGSTLDAIDGELATDGSP
ncbi:hypothetical protein AB0E63_19095 [Kribbella sp. NPDC026596]|uniref:hypothetical protein n=1 Tax=Kribbella sp. NPDC026596 TaxID=3155122 RepID=UPI0033E26C9F